MAPFLQKLGLFSFKHKWLIWGIWLFVGASVVGLAITYQKPASGNITIPGTEAQATIDRVGELFPDATGGTGRIVFEVPAGKTIDDYKQPIEATLAEATTAKDVERIVSPFQYKQAVSKDRRIAFAQVQLAVSRNNVTEQTSTDIQTVIDSHRTDGLVIEAGGDFVNLAPGSILGIGEIIGVLVAALVLIVMFRTIFAAGLPLAVAIFALIIGVGGVFALSGAIDMNTTTPVLAVMLGLAVGIDYSLFILSRYRNYILEGDNHETAIGSAVGTAGNAVIFAAITVVIALSALAVIRIPLLTSMGLAAAGTVAIAAVAAVTLLPAFAGIIGSRVLTRKMRGAHHQSKAHHQIHVDYKSIWYKVGVKLNSKPILVIIISVIALLTLAYPALNLKLGLPTDEFASKSTTERRAFDILSRGFGAGFNGPLLVLVENLPYPDADIPEHQRALVAYGNAQKVAEQIGNQSGVVQAIAVDVTKDGTAAILQVIPSTGPSDKNTSTLIEKLRTDSKLLGDKNIKLSVTGTTAIQKDIDQKMADALLPYLVITVGLSFIILAVAFRSILVPLKATLGFLLSVGAMFGALVIIFQWGAFGLFEPTPIVSFLPIIGLGILFGLAMDYEFFMTSSIREAYIKHGKAKQSVVDGFAMGAKVVTAAAIIMIAVFSGFITNHDDIIKQVGFGLAFGILIDAFIIRMMFGPAVMTLLGDKAWYLPGWLKKIIPRISIEGKD